METNLVQCRQVTDENDETLWFFQEGLQDAGTGHWGAILTHTMPIRFKRVHVPSKKLLCSQAGVRWLNERIICQVYKETFLLARSKLIELSVENQRQGLDPIDCDDEEVIHKIVSKLMGCTYKDITGHDPTEFCMTLTWKSSGNLKLIDERPRDWSDVNFKMPLTIN